MPKVKDTKTQGVPDLTPALGVWAKRHNITPKRFAVGMRWHYNYAWRVLRNKGDKFQPAAYGDFILHFGLGALDELGKIAGVDLNKAAG